MVAPTPPPPPHHDPPARGRSPAFAFQLRGGHDDPASHWLAHTVDPTTVYRPFHPFSASFTEVLAASSAPASLLPPRLVFPFDAPETLHLKGFMAALGKSTEGALLFLPLVFSFILGAQQEDHGTPLAPLLPSPWPQQRGTRSPTRTVCVAGSSSDGQPLIVRAEKYLNYDLLSISNGQPIFRSVTISNFHRAVA